jgi:hypothetical protein
MNSKINRSTPRAVTAPKTQTPKAPAKTETAPAPAKGWAATGAGKTGKVTAPQGGAAAQVKLVSAKITDDLGLGAVDGFPAPKGFTVTQGEDKRSASQALVDGRTATFSWDSATLSAKGPDGKTIELRGKDDAGYTQALSDFTENFKAATKDDLQYQSMVEWDSERGFSGVGTAGKLMSVTESVGDYTGGAHPNHGSQLETFDLSTGKQVTLDQLLSKDQMASLVSTIKTALPKLKGEDGIDGQTFEPYQDLAKHVAENFAISTGKDGKPVITVAWESGVHALGGSMATFTFAAPDDAAFKAKAGLQ